jgi:hypothetical protein
MSMQERGEKYAERMAGISEKVVPHLESLDPADILEKAREIELHDRWSRRNYGLDHQPPNSGPVTPSFLINQAVIQVAPPSQKRILAVVSPEIWQFPDCRRSFGLHESQPLSNCPVNIAVLTNQAAIQIVEGPT